jgi:hypothetical protein
MSVKVYMESDTHSELVAVFDTEELFMLCLPVIEKEAAKDLMIIVDVVDEDFEIITSTDEAKEYLNKKGYVTETMWSKYDIQDNYENVSDEKALEILNGVLRDEYVVGETLASIRHICEDDLGLIPKESENE